MESDIAQELAGAETIQEAVSIILTYWEATKVWLQRMWRLIKRFSAFLVNAMRRIHTTGTRAQRRTAWKLLHPPQKLKRSYRRLQVARRRALDQAMP